MAPAGGLAGRARRPSDDVVRMQDAVHLKLLFFYGYGCYRNRSTRSRVIYGEARVVARPLAARASPSLFPCLVYSRVWRIALISSANC